MYCLNSSAGDDTFVSLDIPDNAYTRAVLRAVKPPSFVVFLTHPEHGRLYYQVTARAHGESAPYSYGLTRSPSHARVFNDRDVWIRAEYFRSHVGRALRTGDDIAELRIDSQTARAEFFAWFESATEWRERAAAVRPKKAAQSKEMGWSAPYLVAA